MTFGTQILFFFSALGVFNALLFGVYVILFKSHKRAINYFLGSLILLICIRVGVSCFYFFDKGMPRVFVQAGLSAQLLLGPWLFLYTKALSRGQNSLSRRDRMLLYGLMAVVVLFGVIYPFERFDIMWDHYLRYVIHTILTTFLILTAFYIKAPLTNWVSNKQLLSKWQHWLVVLYLAVVLYCVGFVISLYTTYALGPVWFSLVFYTTVIYLYFNRKKVGIFGELSRQSRGIAKEQVDNYLQHLEVLMEKEKLYRNPNMKLPELAGRLNISTNTLSLLVNQHLGKSFSVFLNEYRVKEAQQLLETDNQLYTIEAIGFEAGFSSKSSFFSTFRKLTGSTPSAYKKDRLTAQSTPDI